MKKLLLFLLFPLVLLGGEKGFDGPFFVSDTTGINKNVNAFYFYTVDNCLYYSTQGGSYLTSVGSGATFGSLTVDSLQVNRFLVVNRVDTIQVFQIDTTGYIEHSPRYQNFFNMPLGTGTLFDSTLYSGGVLYSFYFWRSAETSLQTDTVGIKIPLPYYFPSFNAVGDSSIRIAIRTSTTSTADNLIDLILYKESAPTSQVIEANCVSSVAKTPRVYDFSANRSVLGSFSNRDVLIVKAVLKSKNNNRAGIGYIKLSW